MKVRPWIWFVIGTVMMMSASISMVVIAYRHQQPDVPIEYEH